MTKTPEEKAREYLKSKWKHIALEDTYYKEEIERYCRNDFIAGYHFRDEEVKELREALKECIENIECIEANVNHSEGFFSALMNATVFCEQAKQLLNKE